MEFGAIKLCKLESTEFGFAERSGFGNKESGELDVTALGAVDSGATTSEVAKLGATEFCKSDSTEFGATESVVESCELSKQGPKPVKRTNDWNSGPLEAGIETAARRWLLGRLRHDHQRPEPGCLAAVWDEVGPIHDTVCEGMRFPPRSPTEPRSVPMQHAGGCRHMLV